MSDIKKPSELAWTIEGDNDDIMHYVKIGRFELVVREYSRRDYFYWFVNNNDKDDDIFWQGFIEGTESSLKKAKKAALKCMADLLKDFKNYEKELTKLGVK